MKNKKTTDKKVTESKFLKYTYRVSVALVILSLLAMAGIYLPQSFDKGTWECEQMIEYVGFEVNSIVGTDPACKTECFDLCTTIKHPQMNNCLLNLDKYSYDEGIALHMCCTDRCDLKCYSQVPIINYYTKSFCDKEIYVRGVK